MIYVIISVTSLVLIISFLITLSSELKRLEKEIQINEAKIEMLKDYINSNGNCR